MRFLIVDQCSHTKAIPDAVERFDDQTLTSHSREELLDRAHVPAVPAGELYDGQQQRLISSATDRLRATGDSVDRVFISAGFGIVDETTELPPYNVTFTDRSDDAITQRARTLEIHGDLQRYIQSGSPYDAIFFALGKNYYLSFDLAELLATIPDTTKIILFNREGVATAHPNVCSIPARTGEAKEQGTIVVALKGQYLLNFAKHREQGMDVNGLADIVSYCTTPITEQTGIEDYRS